MVTPGRGVPVLGGAGWKGEARVAARTPGWGAEPVLGGERRGEAEGASGSGPASRDAQGPAAGDTAPGTRYICITPPLGLFAYNVPCICMTTPRPHPNLAVSPRPSLPLVAALPAPLP